MENKRFEILLKKDRNWLSKYGGFISMIIVIVIVFGIFWIKIPEYQKIIISKDMVSSIKINKGFFHASIGDSLFVINNNEDIILVVDSIKTEKESTIFYFKAIKHDLYSNDYKFIIREQSLLECLMEPFVKKTKTSSN